MVSAASASRLALLCLARAAAGIGAASRALEDAARMGRPVAMQRVLELWRTVRTSGGAALAAHCGRRLP